MAAIAHPLNRRWIAIALLLVTLAGCAIPPVRWSVSGLASCRQRFGRNPADARLAEAQSLLAEAQRASLCGDERCVDLYFQAASLSWCELEAGVSDVDRSAATAFEVYHAAVSELVFQGQRFARFHPSRGLHVRTNDGDQHVPLANLGSRWQPDQFDSLILTDRPHSKRLNRYHRRDGFGVPVIAARERREGERFMKPRQLSSATVVLRRSDALDGEASPTMMLELHDPLQTSSVAVGAEAFPMTADYSAPVKLGLENGSTIDLLRAFVQPWQTRPAESGLFMIQPYQPGKIPVLFVHGLLSDSLTWANAINEVRVQRDLESRYQFWAYQYPTGEPFLQSAAQLRRELAELRAMVDPAGVDPALDHVLIVGHSMGGLVGKLQVTQSDDRLWRAVASRPFSEFIVDPEGRERISGMMFFEPSPMVSRVVFIGTPHQGSFWAEGCTGKLASGLVRESPEARDRHQRVLEANPDMFTSELSRRVPNSVDLLNPSSNLLQTIESLPIAPHVTYHSIIGRGRWMPGVGDTDGVVPVTSSQLSGATTQTSVTSGHTRMTSDPEFIWQLMDIMREHAARMPTPAADSVDSVDSVDSADSVVAAAER